MTDSDKHILRALSDSGFALKPSTIRYNLATRYDYSIAESTMQRRREKLIHAGLMDLEDENGRRYAITDLGKRYLDGELSTEEEMEISTLLQEGPPDED